MLKIIDEDGFRVRIMQLTEAGEYVRQLNIFFGKEAEDFRKAVREYVKQKQKEAAHNEP